VLRKDKKKLEDNLAFLTIESKRARIITDGLQDQVRKAERTKGRLKTSWLARREITSQPFPKPLQSLIMLKRS